MSDKRPSFASRAFGPDSDPDLIVAYQSHQDALRYLSDAMNHASGIALLLGPPGSGKSTLAEEQLGWVHKDVAVSLLDAFKLTPRELTKGMLEQYGVGTNSSEEDMELQELSAFLTGRRRARCLTSSCIRSSFRYSPPVRMIRST